ncbi:hypothetical protein [Salinisphaera sp. T31B1]|uniref:hypothetical protein n=1 Tax=Salinisphaera sp. T31B1 TaxID=727963 RepID=UPI00333E857E
MITVTVTGHFRAGRPGASLEAGESFADVVIGNELFELTRARAFHRRPVDQAAWCFANFAGREERGLEAVFACGESEGRIEAMRIAPDTITSLDDFEGNALTLKKQIEGLRLLGEDVQLDIGVVVGQARQNVSNQTRAEIGKQLHRLQCSLAHRAQAGRLRAAGKQALMFSQRRLDLTVLGQDAVAHIDAKVLRGLLLGDTKITNALFGHQTCRQLRHMLSLRLLLACAGHVDLSAL